ncbi:unnamed protein product, partial [marine sediment metagenome]
GEWCLGEKKYLNVEIYKDLNKVVEKGKRVIVSPDCNWSLLSKGLFGFGALEKEIDVIFPVFHGRLGEDGAIQGLLEHAGVPYVGCGVTGGAVGIDKYVAKRVAESMGAGVVKDELVIKREWKKDKKEMLKKLANLKMPLFVKPAKLGSSIGVVKVEKKGDLEDALDVAFSYDLRVVVEEAVEGVVEVNISILGNGPYKLSVTEKPLGEGETLSFEDKYIGKEGRSKGMAGAKRVMPAPVSYKIIKEIEDLTLKI